MSVAALPSIGAAATEAVVAASTAVADRRVRAGGEAGVGPEAEVGEGKGAWREAEVPGCRGKAAFFFAMCTPCASLTDALTDEVAAGSGLVLPT